jgi:excisionase family DNA binding protein
MSRSVNKHPIPLPEGVGVFTAAEAARYLRSSRETIYGACREGLLDHYYMGRALRIPRRALDDYIAHRVRAQQAEARLLELRR